MKKSGIIMEDVQSHVPVIAACIDRVGVRGIRLPLRVRDRENGSQKTVACVDLGVDLSPDCKGTHMSRFVEELENWNAELDYQSLSKLLENIKKRLNAERAWAKFSFPYFIVKSSPTMGKKGTIAYDCCITSQLDANGHSFSLEVSVPVMTVCPCSKAICREGAHSQRAIIHMQLHLTGFTWLEEFIEMAESCASSEVYTLLKREDEKFVTEHAFANPAFVEDVVRAVAKKIAAHRFVDRFSVEVESMESIHNHNAFARIEHISPDR